MYLKYSFLLVMLFTCFYANAEDKLQNFKEGLYSLRTGRESDCSSGDFSLYRDDGLKLNLAGLHIFDIRNFNERIDDNLDEKRECYYDAVDSLEVVGDTTHLAFKETYKCNNVIKHVLVRRVKISKDFVNLEALQEGERAFSYKCSWLYVGPRDVNSVVRKKNQRLEKHN